MNWPSLLVAAAILLTMPVPAPGQDRQWFPPVARSGLVDEIGALSEEEAMQLRGMLKEAVLRDDVRLVVLILKETPPVSPAEVIKTVLSRQKKCWLRGLICLSADSAVPPLVGCDGPGMADFPAARLQQALATVRDNASNETAVGAQVLRYTADLLDEIHRLRLTNPPVPTTWAGQSMTWAVGHPALTVALPLGAAGLVVAGLRAWRRRPGRLHFPALAMPTRLGAPYAGGSRVSADFDATTVARSRERARR